MRLLLSFILSFAFTAGTAVAQDYECNITRYGGPVNFAGSFQRQKEIMISWMPAQRFFMYLNPDQTILHHSGGDDGQTPASNINLTGNEYTFMFIDHPISSANTSRIRRTRITFNQSDLSFSIHLRMGNGPGVRRSGGAAWGQCSTL